MVSCSIDQPMMLLFFVAEGGLSVLVWRGSGRGNELPRSVEARAVSTFVKISIEELEREHDE